MTRVVAGLFPNPISWGWDQLSGWAGGVAGDAAKGFFSALVAWVLNGAIWAVTQTYAVALGSTQVDVGAAWFTDSIFATSALTGAALFGIAWVFAVASAAIRGAPGELVGHLVVQTPKVVVLFAVLIEFTSIAVLATDEVAAAFAGSALGVDAGNLFAGFEQLGDLSSQSGSLTSFVVLVISVLLMLAGVLVWLVLLLRAAVIYLLVMLCPVLAVLMVTRYQAAVRKLLETLLVVIVAKALIVMTLVLGAAAMLHTPGITDGLLGDPTALGPLLPPPAAPGELPPEPVSPDEVDAAAEQAATTQVVGQLLVGAVVILLALFSPWVVFGLIPDASAAAAVTQAARGGALSDVSAAPGVAGTRAVLARRRVARHHRAVTASRK